MCRRPRALLSKPALVLPILMLLATCNNPVEAPDPLYLSVTADSAVTIHDTLKIIATVPGAAIRGVRYVCFIDRPADTFSTADCVITRICRVADTGSHFAVVKAIGSDGVSSLPDTVRFTVGYRRPSVTISGPTDGFAGTPCGVRFTSVRGITPIDRFFWFLDDPLNRKATIDSTLSWTWKAGDTGNHLLVVQAMDRDSLFSLPETLALRVDCTRPLLRKVSDTTVKINDTLIVPVAATDPVLPVVSYAWKVDDAATFSNASDSALRLVWRVADTGVRRLIVVASNSEGGISDPDTSRITVTAARPIVALVSDTLASISDTCLFSALASDRDGIVVLYRWSIDNAPWMATDTAAIRWVFGGKSESVRTVRTVAVDNDGLASDTVSALIRITLQRPLITLLSGDTTCFANHPLTFRAQAFDSNGTIAQYRWRLDGRLLASWLSSDSAVLQWTAQGAGNHFLVCSVVDNDSLESLPDSVSITVLSGGPVVRAMNDTAISSLDSILVTCTASDPNGSIVRYLWNIGGSGWTDSTTQPANLVHYTGQPQVRVIVGVRDNDGLVAMDTTVISFNRPPDSISLSSPRQPDDTSWLSIIRPADTVAFSFFTTDPDGDPVTYTLYWGNRSDSLGIVYRGQEGAASVAVTQPGVRYWRLTAEDTTGLTRSTSGTVTVMREYRICYIGHSIVTGDFGNGIMGGFRAAVLDTLRSLLPASVRLKAVGPRTTFNMSRSEVDDSCLAVSGYRAIDIYQMLIAEAPALKADIWVFLTGANGSFDISERYYTNQIMETMYARNRDSRIYVLNSPPLSSGYTTHMANLPGFNQILADSVAAKVARGAPMFLVDAFSALTTNGQYNQAWYNSDGIHPNQTGYDRLVTVIKNRMKGSLPPAIPAAP